MMRKIILTLAIWLSLSGLCFAQNLEFDLSAGTTSVAGGIQYRKPLATGFMKVGMSGIYTDDDDKEYQWGAMKFVVGSDSMVKGLSAEVGLKGIFGSAEDNGLSGDVGAAAFTINAVYLIPSRAIPLPIEVFGGVTYAPETLSFMDAEEYLEITLGAGVRIVENASIVLSLHSYKVDLDAGPVKWSLDDDVLRLGVVMRF